MNCKCGKASNPKSTKGYCTDCMKVARDAWKQRIIDSKQQRESRDMEFAELYSKAHSAGHKAAVECKPVGMRVIGHGQTWDVPDGVCGFAWVTIHPGNCAFANYIKKHHGSHAHKAYRGGLQIWVSDYDQSMQRKQAYADAFSRVIREAGIECYSGSRMD